MSDVFLKQIAQGGEITYVGGAPKATDGLEVAAYLSLFGGNYDDDGRSNSRLAYWGNLLEDEERFKLISRTQHLLQTISLTTANVQRLKQAAAADLAWFIEGSIASSVEVQVSVTNVNRVRFDIEIEAVGETRRFTFTETWGAMAAAFPIASSVGSVVVPYSSGGKSLRFDQDSDGLAHITNGNWGIANEYTILVWVKPDSSGTETTGSILSPGDPGQGDEDGIQLIGNFQEAEDQQYRIVLREGASVFKDYRFGTGILNDSWTLVGFSWNGASDSLVCFQDGSIVTPGLTPTDNAGTQTDAARDGGLGIHAQEILGFCWVGLIHNVMMWNLALNEANVFALFNGGDGDGFNPAVNSGGYTQSSAQVQWWLPGTKLSPNLGASAENSPGSIDFTSELGTIDDTHIVNDAPTG